MSIESDYNKMQEEDYQEYLEFKEKRDREKGILPEGYSIGDTLSPKTVKSYSKLGLDTPDNVYFASRRPTERMLKMCKAIAAEKGQNFEVKKTITRVYRLKDKEGNGREYLAWNERLEFMDRMDNLHSISYDYCGTHPEVIGEVRKNVNGQIIGGQVTATKQVFDKIWSTKAFEELMAQHQGGEKETAYNIGFAKTRGKSGIVANSDKVYRIHNIEDFKAKFEELWELGRRALSDRTGAPCLSKLKNPISEDPPTSEVKRERFMINPNAVSYSQGSYR